MRFFPGSGHRSSDASILSISFAYVEFAEPEHIDAALAMDNSLFRGRLIKVSTSGHFLGRPLPSGQVTGKRTNVPGFNRGRGRGSYRGGYRGGFRGGGGYSPYRARGRLVES